MEILEISRYLILQEREGYNRWDTSKVRYVARYIRKDKSSDRFECRIFTDVQWT